MQEDKASRSPIQPFHTNGKTESTTMGNSGVAQAQLQPHLTLNSNGGNSVNSTNQGAPPTQKSSLFLGFKGILKKNFTVQQ